MSNPGDNTTKLIADTLHDDWANGPAADFARTAAAHARRRRRVKIGASAAASVAVGAMAIFVNLRQPEPTSPHPTAFAQRAPAGARPGYEIISDDELLTQVRDQPLLALKNHDGSREIVVLPNE